MDRPDFDLMIGDKGLFQPSPLFGRPKQAWEVGGLYVRCGHLESVQFGCFGREREDERRLEMQFLKAR
jgi:hypothetical protein